MQLNKSNTICVPIPQIKYHTASGSMIKTASPSVATPARECVKVRCGWRSPYTQMAMNIANPAKLCSSPFFCWIIVQIPAWKIPSSTDTTMIASPIKIKIRCKPLWLPEVLTSISLTQEPTAAAPMQSKNDFQSDGWVMRMVAAVPTVRWVFPVKWRASSIFAKCPIRRSDIWGHFIVA